MKVRQFSNALRTGASAVLLFCAIAAPLAQTPEQTGTPITSDAKKEVLTSVTDRLTHQAYVPTIDFDKWPDFVQNEKPKLDAATTEEEFGRAMNEALTKFGASHIFLATPRMAEARRDASMVGIGITQTATKDGILVLRVVAGGPAETAGLIPGDLITKIDGQAVDALKNGVKGIPGKEDTQVVLTVKHQDGATRDYTLTRKKFSTIWPEELTEVDKDTARLSIHTFDWTYSKDNVENLMRKAEGYKNLILDLRGNGGGAVINLQHLLGMLIPYDSSIGTFVNKQMVNSYVREAHGKPSEVVKIADWSRHQDEWEFQQVRPLKPRDLPMFKGNVVVLVNAFSGSASEIAAAALHDLIGANIVGQKSAGAVLVSVITPATNHFTLQYPIMDYVTIRGVRLEGTGVEPQVTVTAKGPVLPGQPDEAVNKAQALFARDKHDDKGIGL